MTALGLLTIRSKTELVNRLMAADSSGGWANVLDHEDGQEVNAVGGASDPELATFEREMDILCKEKLIMERELRLVLRRGSSATGS